MYNKMTIKTCLSQIIETDKASIKDCNVSLIFVQLFNSTLLLVQKISIFRV